MELVRVATLTLEIGRVATLTLEIGRVVTLTLRQEESSRARPEDEQHWPHKTDVKLPAQRSGRHFLQVWSCAWTRRVRLSSPCPEIRLPKLLDASHRRLTVPVVAGSSEDGSCQRDPRSHRVLHSTLSLKPLHDHSSGAPSLQVRKQTKSHTERRALTPSDQESLEQVASLARNLLR